MSNFEKVISKFLIEEGFRRVGDVKRKRLIPLEPFKKGKINVCIGLNTGERFIRIRKGISNYKDFTFEENHSVEQIKLKILNEIERI